MKDKKGFKKQLAGGAVYAALAVTIVAVTVSTITATFTDKDSGNTTTTPDTIYKNSTGIKLPAPSANDFTLDTPVSDIQSGVDASVTPSTTDNTVSAAPKIEISEEPDKSETNTSLPENGANIQEEPPTSEKAPASDPEPDKSSPAPEEPNENEQVISYNGYIRPCSGYISKEFSIELPVYSPTMYDYRTHSGIDIACDIGTPVKAVTGGTICEISDDFMMGTTVTIEHPDGIKSVYSNLSADLPSGIEAGTVVATGDIIGGIGDTALCESAEVSHLHFEMVLDGKHIDPEDYIPG